MTVMRAFMAAQDLADYPKMLIPFDRNKMVDFYLKEAKRIGKKLFI